jgi:hypothetical protein
MLPLSIRLGLSCLFALLFLTQSTLSAAEAKPVPPVSLAGKSYNLTYPTEKGAPKDTIKFEEKTLSIGSVGAAVKIPYMASKAGRSQSIEFNGTFTDEKGRVIEVSGTITSKGEIHGSVTVRPKDGDPFAKNFNGAAPGAAGEKKK